METLGNCPLTPHPCICKHTHPNRCLQRKRRKRRKTTTRTRTRRRQLLHGLGYGSVVKHISSMYAWVQTAPQHKVSNTGRIEREEGKTSGLYAKKRNTPLLWAVNRNCQPKKVPRSRCLRDRHPYRTHGGRRKEIKVPGSTLISQPRPLLQTAAQQEAFIPLMQVTKKNVLTHSLTMQPACPTNHVSTTVPTIHCGKGSLNYLWKQVSQLLTGPSFWLGAS